MDEYKVFCLHKTKDGTFLHQVITNDTKYQEEIETGKKYISFEVDNPIEILSAPICQIENI